MGRRGRPAQARRRAATAPSPTSSTPSAPRARRSSASTSPSRAPAAIAKPIRVLLITRRGAIRARTKAINHLKALVVTAREELRHQLRNTPTDELVYRCARLRTLPSHSTEHRATVIALRHTARRILALEAEANDLETEIERLVKRTVPQLLDEIGVGPISAAQLYCSWSHRGRLRSDAAFAMLGGAAPIPASSGQTDPLPPQPRRRPPAQLRAAHDRPHPPAARPRHPRLRRPPRSPKARPRARSSAASSATSPATSSASSKPPARTPSQPRARRASAPSDTALDRHVAAASPDPEFRVVLLETIPGIGNLLARTMATEICDIAGSRRRAS